MLYSVKSQIVEIYASCIVYMTKLSSYSSVKQVEILLTELEKLVHSHAVYAQYLPFSFCLYTSAFEMTYIVSSGALNSTHSLTLLVHMLEF